MDNPMVVELACLLQSLGWVCLTFDFRGHRGAGAGAGASWRGHVERADLQSCVDWLLHAYESLNFVCMAGYSYGALVASSCLPHPLPDRKVECSWLFVSLPLDAYKYSLWMFPKPRRTCNVRYVLPTEERLANPRKSFSAGLSALSRNITSRGSMSGTRPTKGGSQELPSVMITTPQGDVANETVEGAEDAPLSMAQAANALSAITTMTSTIQEARPQPARMTSSESVLGRLARRTLTPLARNESSNSLRSLSSNATASTSTTATTLSYRSAQSASAKAKQNKAGFNPHVLAIWGTKDEFASKRRCEAKRSRKHGWRCEFVPGATHWFDEEQDEIIKQVLEKVQAWVDNELERPLHDADEDLYKLLQDLPTRRSIQPIDLDSQITRLAV
ncbi:hypothetical protein PYCC9005_001869 [Savitreella phatthalungensis]